MAEPEVASRFGDIFPPPYSVLGLPKSLMVGLYFIGMSAVISIVTTVVLLGFISYRMIAWKRHYDRNVGHNQCVIFIFNLLLADLFQASSFVISFNWLRLNAIIAPTPVCTAQGLLLNFGDLSSGFFVLAIAVHTWVSVVKGVQVRLLWFVVAIACVWTGSIFLTSFGLGRHGKHFFVRTGAWCWISTQFDQERLWLHYFWIFLFEASTVIIYAHIFFNLRARFKTIRFANNANFDRIRRAAVYMAVYPVVYVLLTLPLAVGRMASLAGANPPDAFYIFAGCLMTSAGWVDSLLYTLTRKVLVTDGFHAHPALSGNGSDNQSHGGGRPHSFGLGKMLSGAPGSDHVHARTVTITGGGNPAPSVGMPEFNKSRSRGGRRGSTASAKKLTAVELDGGMPGFGDVKAETKVEVTVVQTDRPNDSRDSTSLNGAKPQDGMRTGFPFN